MQYEHTEQHQDHTEQHQDHTEHHQDHTDSRVRRHEETRQCCDLIGDNACGSSAACDQDV